MLENEAEILKLQESLKKKFPQLNSAEIKENSRQLVELALFLVRLKIKQHSKPPKPINAGGLEIETRHPP